MADRFGSAKASSASTKRSHETIGFLRLHYVRLSSPLEGSASTLDRLNSEQLKKGQEKTLAAPRMRYGLLARVLFVSMKVVQLALLELAGVDRLRAKQ
jgi:hypothetical protein